MALKPGDILRDKYRIDALIGRGGMGHVFAATDLVSRDQVAVKVVSRANVDDVLMVRLHREAEAATRIQSDFVPRVIEVSETEEGETFFAMERLFGETLSHRIRKGGPLGWNEVHQIGEDILCGLIDAHAAGVVHRDLKPSNIFLARRESEIRAMILDFGVCKMIDVDTEQLTGTGESIGTVAYMAPEQVRGAAHVDARADLFGFGVLIFEMLTGRLPHEGPSQMAILANKLERSALPLKDFARVPIPEGAVELVMRTIERDPGSRYASAQELLDAWRALGRSNEPVLTPVAFPAAEEAPLPEADAPTEISRPPAALLALSAPDPVDQAADDEAIKDLLPTDFHPTQTALSTHYTSRNRKSGVVRGAMLLACAALVGGVSVVAVSVSRGADAKRTTPSEAPVLAASSAVVAPETAAAPADGASTPENAGAAPAETRSEPVAVEEAPRASKSKHHRHRTPASSVAGSSSAAPTGSGLRITEKIRF